MGEAGLMLGTRTLARSQAAVPAEPRPGARLSFAFLWLFLVAIYARPEDIYPPLGHLHLTLLLGACATLAFLWSLLLHDVTLAWPRELKLVLLLTLWFAAGVPFAYWRGGSFMVLTELWLKTVLIFFLMTQTLLSLERVRWVLWAIILSELLASAYSLLGSAQVKWVEGRMFGVNQGFLGWNFLGIAAALTLPYIAALFIAHRSLVRSCLLAAAVVCMLWMLVLTASRSGMLDVAVSVLATSLLVLRGSSRGRMIGAGIVVALVIVVGLAPSVFWERMDTLSGHESATAGGTVGASAVMSENDRLAVLERSVDFTLQHPIFGLGLGNLAPASGNELLEPDAWVGSHNTFTEMSSEGGVPALLLFLALLVTALRSMKRVGRMDFEDPAGAELALMARATRASLLVFLFAAWFAHVGYEYFLYTGPVALAVGLHRIAAERSGPETRTEPQPAWAQPVAGWSR